MNKVRRTYLARFLAFIGILICIFQLLNYIPKQERANHRPFWRYFYQELPENSVDIVFIGNSHSYCTFIPEIMDTLLGTKSVNVGTPSESIYQTKYEYMEILRYQNPEVVVIEANVIYSGVNRPAKGPWLFSFFDPMPFSLRKVQYLIKLFSPGDLIRYLFPFTTKHTDWKTPYVPINEAVKKFGEANTMIEIENQGYYPLYNPLLPGKVRKASKCGEQCDCPVSDFNDRLKATDDVLRIDESDLSTLLIIEAPRNPNLCNCCKNQTFALLDSYGIAHFDILENIAASSLWFHKSNHVTQFGAVIASIETAQLLSEKLDIAMNQDALEYFKSFQFRDYTFTKDDKTVSITLIPLNEEVSKNLNYHWVVLRDGEIFHEEIQGGNQFDFILPDPKGNYLIRVKINNPGGDYELVGEFSVNKDIPSEVIDE